MLSRRAAFLLLGPLLLSFWIFVWGLPFLAIGFWKGCDGIFLALMGMGTLEALFLGSVCVAKFPRFPLRMGGTSTYCFCLGLLTLFLWSFHPHWRGDIFGSPQLGEGLLTIASLTTLALAAENISTSLLKKWVVPTACFAAMACCVLILANHPRFFNLQPVWICHRFPSYLVFFAIGLIPAGCLYSSALARTILWGFCVFLICVSFNKTALFALPLCALIACLPFPFLRRWRTPLALFISLIPIFALVALSISDLSTLIERWHFVEIVGAYFRENPCHLFTGVGWGQFADTTVKMIRQTSVHLYKEGVFSPNWCGLSFAYSFHTMHNALEWLLSLGLGGFLLFLSIPSIALRKLPLPFWKPCAISLVLFMSVSSSWFICTICWPFLILGFVIIGRLHTLSFAETPQPSLEGKGRIYAFYILLTVCILGMSWGTWRHFRCVRSYGAPSHSLLSPLSQKIRRGSAETTGLHLASFIHSVGLYTDGDTQKKLLNVGKSLPDPPLLLELSLLKLGSSLIENHQQDDLWSVHDLKISAFLKKAPYRTDVAVTHVRSMNPTPGMRWIKQHLSPSDPVRMHLIGEFYQQTGKHALAKICFQKAQKERVGLWIPAEKRGRE